ncbi:MAG: hypothetical protein K2F74_06355 [Muribaculaceae bacterium]|nr:hypothetical protein [Muribaculaceae bacterium]
MIYINNNIKKACRGAACSVLPYVLSLLLFACIGSPLQAQNRGFTAYAGYTGSFCDVKSYGADLSLAYNIPVYKAFSIIPEAGFDFRSVDLKRRYFEKQLSFVVRASLACTLRLSGLNLSLFTGPRMNVTLAHTEIQTEAVLYDPITNTFYGSNIEKFNTVSAAWQIGLSATYKRMVFRGIYALPMTTYKNFSGKEPGKKTNIYELGVGYCF